MFACPNCRTRLAKQPSPEGPRWLCGACGGRALHLPSLRCTPAGSFVRRLSALARGTPVDERTRACPICDTSMPTVPTIAVPGSAEPLRLDLCVSCQFVWFDPTEHEAWGRASASAATDYQLPAETRAALARLPPVPSPDLVIEADQSMPEPFFTVRPRDEDLEFRYLVCVLGLPVEVDPPPLHDRPWATWMLAVLVTVVSLAAAKNMPSALEWAFVPAEMWRHGGLTLVTSFFLHGDPWHLIANMYFLVILGDNVEDLLGWPRYLALLLAGTVIGNLCHAAIDPSSRIPAIGASGGIATVILYYGLLFPEGRLRLFLRFAFVDVSVKAALGLWVGVQVIGTLAQMAWDTPIAYAAHLGGALAGVLFWWAKMGLPDSGRLE